MFKTFFHLVKKATASAVLCLPFILSAEGAAESTLTGLFKELIRSTPQAVADEPLSHTFADRAKGWARDTFTFFGINREAAHQNGLIKLATNALTKKFTVTGADVELSVMLGQTEMRHFAAAAKRAGGGDVFKYDNTKDRDRANGAQGEKEYLLFNYNTPAIDPITGAYKSIPVTIYSMFYTILDQADKLKREGHQNDVFQANYQKLHDALTESIKIVHQYR